MKYLLLFALFQCINSEENCLTPQECQYFVSTYPVYDFIRQSDACVYSENNNNYCITKCTAFNCNNLIKFGIPYVQNYYAKPIGITTPPSPPPSSTFLSNSSLICTIESIDIRSFFQNMLQVLGITVTFQ